MIAVMVKMMLVRMMLMIVVRMMIMMMLEVVYTVRNRTTQASLYI
jgi:hypothetical protein